MFIMRHHAVTAALSNPNEAINGVFGIPRCRHGDGHSSSLLCPGEIDAPVPELPAQPRH